MTCPICGTSDSLQRCGSCKGVGYCFREHQREHWKKHRAECTYQSTQLQPETPSPNANRMVVVVEIESGQGDGLTNRMINHVFDLHVLATRYIRQRLGYNQTEEIKELREMPFLRELMGFSSGVIFVNPRLNAFAPLTKGSRHHFNCFGIAGGELNAMAIFLGYKVDNGLSTFLNVRGDAFFIGTTAKGEPVTSNVLWGAANFVYQSMAFYPDEDLEQEREANFRKWRRRYNLRTWEPMAGNGGINLYQTDPFQCAQDWPVVGHRTP